MAHKRGHEPGDKPQVGLDYKSFGQEADRDDKTTMIVLKDRESGAMFTHICLCKGPNDVWIVDQLVSDINGMGHTEVVVKTDGEPALVKLMEAVQEKRKHPSIPMHPPAYDPQSNGAIEKGVGDSMGQIRAIKIGLERRIKARIGAEWPIMQWIVEYAGVTLTWFQVGHDGRTAHRRLKGKDSSQPVVEFGEQILDKPMRSPQSNRKRSLMSKWVHGTWLGVTRDTGENLVALEGGGAVIRVRTIQRKPEVNRWSEKALKEIQATPREPNPRDLSQKAANSERDTEGAKVVVEVKGDGSELADTKEERKTCKPKSFRITKEILEMYGFDENCYGCMRTMVGETVS